MPTSASGRSKSKVIALTGATGFLGQHVLKALVDAGHTVRALTRRPQTATLGIDWIEGDLTDLPALTRLCAGADVLIHMAGLTKALSRADFFDINVAGSLRVFTAAASAGVKQVLHISSLAAREPGLSHYGASKAGSELLLTARKWPFVWSIIRPPAIYGPGDKEILKLLKAIGWGILPAPGGRKNRFSMIHAADLATAICLLTVNHHPNGLLEIDDYKAGGYQLSDVAAALCEEGQKAPKVIPVPFFILGALGAINGLLAAVIRQPAMLTFSTARYLCYPDWVIREQRRPLLPGWKPQFSLKAGLSDTIDWYKKNGLL